MFAAAMVVLATFSFNTLRLRHINETITYSLATFEILRPYVGEDKYFIFRSRYFATRTASQFDLLHKEIITIAAEKKLILPDYQPL